MNLLTMESVTKAFTDRVLLDKVNFSINEHEKIGVVGVNGTGKSTLLKIIAGLESADEGSVTKGNQVHLRYLPQTPEFESGMTILQAVLKDNITEMNEWSIEAQAKAMIHKLELPGYDEKIDHLSGGQRKRVALGNALLAPVEVLILDEPTNHLDNAISSWLEEYLTAFKGAIVMVTHDRYFLDRVATRIDEIDRAKIYSYPGNYSAFVDLKSQRQDMAIATERKRQSLLRTELEWLHRGARARSTKQKAHIQRIDDMMEMKAPQTDALVTMNSISSRMGKKTIELDGICKAYGERKIIEDFTYIFLKNDRIGIIGENGCGKSTLLKIITDVIPADQGTVEVGDTIRIGYFSQENESMDGRVRVIDYIKEVGDYIQTTDGVITAAQMLERFLFEGSMQYSLIEKLSGGEKRRLYLLRVLMSAPNVLILDEPTNDLDIQTLTILEDYLDHFEGIVITVSHDRYFLDRIVRRIFAFEGGGTIRQYEGGYSDYLIARPEEKVDDSDTDVSESKNEETTWKSDRTLKFSYKEKQEFEVIDEQIADLEDKIATLEDEITQNASDYGKLNTLMEAKTLTEHELEEKMDRWVYLNDLSDRIEAQKNSEKDT